MKKIVTAILVCFCYASYSQEEEKSQSPRVYLGGGISIANGSFNNYKVGNANEFYQFLTGNPSLKLDDGAIGFKYFSLGFLGSGAKNNRLSLGAELSLIAAHPTRAISGTNHGITSTGASMNFGFKMIDLSMRIGPKLDAKGSNISVEAGWGMAFMSGTIATYGTGGDTWIQKGATDTGMRGGISMDIALGKSFLINGRMGYRLLKVQETHEDPDGKAKTFYANGNSGDLLVVDWSGSYASIGLALIFPSKKK